METETKEITALFAETYGIYVIAGIVAIVIFAIIIRKNSKKKVMRDLEDLHVRFTAANTVPLPYKLLKANALARVNQETAKIVADHQPLFDQTQANIKDLKQLLADTEDYISLGKFSLAKQNNKDIDGLLTKTEQSVKQLDEMYDNILQQEVELREEITAMKETFRKMRAYMNENSTNYVFCFEALEKRVSVIEKLFSTFEEWMYASEFQRASDVKEEIQKSIENLRSDLKQLPALLMKARGVLPRLMEEVKSENSRTRQKGVYIKHLDVVPNMEIVSDLLKSDVNSLRNAQVEGIDESLEDCKVRMQQLLAQMDRECKAYDEVSSMMGDIENSVAKLSNMLLDVKTVHAKASERFGFEDMESSIEECQIRFDGLKKDATEIDGMLDGKQTPYTIILQSLRELQQTINLLDVDVTGLQEKLNGACHDENHAKEQLQKLHLVLNEMKSKVRNNRLPSISVSYTEDIKTATNYVLALEDILNETPLNVSKMNKTLEEATDFTYRLYNNVNKIIGTAKMVENTIVFGNRYRSTYPSVDAELTRAELSYRNGEYTKALKEALSVIESIHPGAAEKLIKANAQRA